MSLDSSLTLNKLSANVQGQGDSGRQAKQAFQFGPEALDENLDHLGSLVVFDLLIEGFLLHSMLL